MLVTSTLATYLTTSLVPPRSTSTHHSLTLTALLVACTLATCLTISLVLLRSTLSHHPTALTAPVLTLWTPTVLG